MLILLIIILLILYFLTKHKEEGKIVLIKRESKHRKRDRRKINDITFTQMDKKYIFEKFNYKCFNCGSKKNLTIDHHYPLEKGYRLKISEEIFNAVLLCEKCNRKKSNKMPENFYNKNQIQILSEKYGITKDILNKNEDISQLIEEKAFVEFIYLGKNYRGRIRNILSDNNQAWGVKRKIYLELEIEGESYIFPFNLIRELRKMKNE